MFKRKLLGIGGILVISLALVLVTIRPAQAHPIVVQTDPPDGATLEASPGEVRLFLNQPVLLDFTTVDLVDGDGNHFTPLSILAKPKSGETTTSPSVSQAADLVIKLPALTANSYRLSWKTRSKDDFHISTGTIVFGVQKVVNESAASGPALPSWWDLTLRWLNFGAITGFIGLLGFGLLVLQKNSFLKDPGQTNLGDSLAVLQEQLKRYAQRTGWAALVVGFFFICGQGLGDALPVERWWELLTGTAFGLRWLAGEVILGLVLALLYRGARPWKLPLYNGLMLVLLAALAGTASQNTHAGLPGSSPVLNFLADSLHLMGASLWVGGLVAVFLVLGPRWLNRQTEDNNLARLILVLFSKLAALSLVVLVVTGFYKSGQQIASLDALLTTLYGQALLFKFQLVLFAALIGFFNALILNPGLRRRLHLNSPRFNFKPRFLKRTLLIEIVTLGIVLGVAAFLSGAEPARGPEFAPPPVNTPTAASTDSYSTAVNDLIVSFSVKPNRPGRNFVDLSLLNTRRPAPAPFDKVSLRLISPTGQETLVELPFSGNGNGRYQLSADQIQTAGNWQVQVVIERPNLPLAQANFGWKVLDTPEVGSRRPVVFSNQPLQPWFNLASSLTLLVTTLLWLGWKLAGKRLLAHPINALLTLVAIRKN